jgi:geranylgeranyl diphosphate synthase type I
MPPGRDDASYVIEIHNLIAGVLGEHLQGCSLLGTLETALGAIKLARGGSASFLLLPIWVCEAAGGEPRQATPVAASWCLLYEAASLLDDVQDDDLGDELWPAMSPAQATNVATALIFLSQLVLGCLRQAGVDVELALAIQRAFNRASLRVCAGQHIDLAADAITLKQYWRVAAAKSGQPFSVACRTGAMLGTEDPSRVDHYGAFGHNLGVLVQISDDVNGVWRSREGNDLVVGSRTLPLIYALSVASPDHRSKLHDLLSRIPAERSALDAAQQMIADAGALQYSIVQAEIYRNRAKAALIASGGSGAAQSRLATLLNRVLPALSVTDRESAPED